MQSVLTLIRSDHFQWIITILFYFKLKEHSVYVYDERTGRKDRKLPFKLPGWIIAKTMTLLRRRDGSIENDCEDPVQRETCHSTSTRNGRSRSGRNRLSQIFEKPELVYDNPTSSDDAKTNQISQKLAAIQKATDELKLLLNQKDWCDLSN